MISFLLHGNVFVTFVIHATKEYYREISHSMVGIIIILIFAKRGSLTLSVEHYFVTIMSTW